ncbi:hypothetical protein C3432_25495 [Citrobacter amalonaticus]|uniref:Uncharacterized protein n=1 Tax=Citrobacter amalonaticus TaxID=35703 RepID=A0A2S4RR21_CITAM|nr:hypothetical protein C3432_25495 [Citrobacter amalonaticus]POT69862.1 hypothetical protein C3436_25295 [Citrobacter amalonaticus]POU61121.1 hypothetical protein C3430_24205 [Citrobacter amalonaticus]POV02334.1 hypothetical protein C3424_26975 [Citrobacter amalonaticus]
MRRQSEDSARLLPATACFLCRIVVPHAKISRILPTERTEMLSPEPFPVAEFSYSQITARDLSINLQPRC